MTSTPMAPNRLQDLPLHVLDELCGRLTRDKAGRRGLLALSLTSTRLAGLTTRFRLQTVHLVVKGPQKLRSDIATLTDVLAARDNVPYVRRLEIRGSMSRAASGERQSGGDHGEQASLQGANGPVHDYWPPDDGDFWGPAREPVDFDPTGPGSAGQGRVRDQAAWSCLASFIGELIQLADVVYACEDQVPVCILEVLHTHPLRPRLHVHSFSLRSLYQPASSLRDIDLDEYILASSPCLSSIRARDTASGFDSRGRISFNEEAILRMVAGRLCALRAVSIWVKGPGETIEHHRALSAPRPAWAGYFRNDAHGFPDDGLGTCWRRMPDPSDRHGLEQPHRL